MSSFKTEYSNPSRSASFVLKILQIVETSNGSYSETINRVSTIVRLLINELGIRPNKNEVENLIRNMGPKLEASMVLDAITRYLEKKVNNGNQKVRLEIKSLLQEISPVIKSLSDIGISSLYALDDYFEPEILGEPYQSDLNYQNLKFRININKKYYNESVRQQIVLMLNETLKENPFTIPNSKNTKNKQINLFHQFKTTLINTENRYMTKPKLILEILKKIKFKEVKFDKVHDTLCALLGVKTIKENQLKKIYENCVDSDNFDERLVGQYQVTLYPHEYFILNNQSSEYFNAIKNFIEVITEKMKKEIGPDVASSCFYTDLPVNELFSMTASRPFNKENSKENYVDFYKRAKLIAKLRKLPFYINLRGNFKPSLLVRSRSLEINDQSIRTSNFNKSGKHRFFSSQKNEIEEKELESSSQVLKELNRVNKIYNETDEGLIYAQMMLFNVLEDSISFFNSYDQNSNEVNGLESELEPFLNLMEKILQDVDDDIVDEAFNHSKFNELFPMQERILNYLENHPISDKKSNLS